MDEIIIAMLGDIDSQKKITEKNEILPCSRCNSLPKKI